MKPMSEAHFAILRRHMVEVIGIQVEYLPGVGVPIGAVWDHAKPSFSSSIQVLRQNRRGVPVRC
jgi:hypothetical protein